MCDDVPYIEAAPGLYRDSPIYVGNPDAQVEALQGWAVSKPGFEELWIDRSHLGWITLAFSVDATARQTELEQEFPEMGAVVVGVDWTMAELRDLQQRVVQVFRGQGIGFSSGAYPNKGVVSIELAFLKPELVAIVEQNFAGQRVCLSGGDPADAPIEGPQPTAGNGWRLLADQDETGSSYRTGIAYDAASYEQLWSFAGIAGNRPAVDFQAEVVIWFGAVHGSSCPRLRLDDVVVDTGRSLVHGEITYLDVGVCTDDAIPHAYVVALERSRLPRGPFAIQLGADDPPAGVPEERTVVEADLSGPGSVADPSQVHAGGAVPPSFDVGPGGIIEPGMRMRYRQSAHCGVEWLGPINEVYWRAPEASGTDWLPPAWRDLVLDGSLTITVVLHDDVQPPRIDASAAGATVLYEASAEIAPGCD